MSSKTSLLIEQYEIGPLNNFLYLLGDPQTKEMTVIDPAWDVPFLINQAKALGYKITQVFLTHAHPDHVNGLNLLLETYNVPVYISKYESATLTAKLKNLVPVDNHAKLKVGNVTFEALYAPGHTPGCQIFYLKDNAGTPIAICGDVLFIDGCGRCDLPGGDARKMYQSLTDVIKKLPNNTVVFPGHNYGPTPTDTIGHQKSTNPYLKCESMQEFLNDRMGL